MNSQSAFQFSFDCFPSTPTVVEFSAAQLSSDAGLLPFRQLDEWKEVTIVHSATSAS